MGKLRCSGLRVRLKGPRPSDLVADTSPHGTRESGLVAQGRVRTIVARSRHSQPLTMRRETQHLPHHSSAPKGSDQNRRLSPPVSIVSLASLALASFALWTWLPWRHGTDQTIPPTGLRRSELMLLPQQ